jgi:hypothetical protein
MHNLNWIFFASVAVFVWLFGLCRKVMTETAKAKQTAKILYDDTHTIYLDGRPCFDGSVILGSGEGLGD